MTQRLLQLGMLVVCGALLCQPARAASTERVSVSSSGVQADRYSHSASISADGRFLAFTSEATNLVPGDTNGWDDVFVRNRLTGTTERISVASDEVQGDGPSFVPSISADGRFVVFASGASNFVAGDGPYYDIFLRDRLTGTTERISVDSNEIGWRGDSRDPSLSADGRFVVFSSVAELVANDSNGAPDIFVRDRQAGTTEMVSVASNEVQANSQSDLPFISADGRFVAFVSLANNLVASDTNGPTEIFFTDIFVRDRQTGTTQAISVASDETPGNTSSWSPSISGDGRFVAFQSSADNLVAGDTNSRDDVFVRDRLGGTTERVSIDSNEVQGNAFSIAPQSARTADSLRSNPGPATWSPTTAMAPPTSSCATGSPVLHRESASTAAERRETGRAKILQSTPQAASWRLALQPVTSLPATLMAKRTSSSATAVCWRMGGTTS